MTAPLPQIDPRLDLVLEREIDVPPELVWKAWTMPEHLKQWFTPKPWQTADCTIDLRPGGAFYTVMRSPEGEEFPGSGCYLEVVENERLVWTAALLPGFRPSAEEDLVFTAIITMEPSGSGTKYRAVAMHKDEKTRESHEQMGFHEGWGTALEQMIALVKQM